MARRLMLIVVVIVALLAACGIPNSGDVARIPANEVGALDDTLPPTTTTTTTIPETTIEPTTTTQPAITTTSIATEEVNLYFIDSSAILRRYSRPIRRGASSSEVLSALQEGPPVGDIGVGLRTALPTERQAPLKVNEDGSGVATVDLPANFYDPNLMKQEDQGLAIGQIVLTLTEIGGIGQVLFTLAGQPIGVLRGSGDLSQPGQPLPRRDYLNLLESSTPTTTTTTPAVPATTV